MLHVTQLEAVSLEEPSLVTIGVFDGVHRGHQVLIKELVAEAHAADKQAVVLTFHPHPDVVVRGLEGRYYLTTPEQRARVMGSLGVDLVVTHPFDDTVRAIRAADFVKKLVDHLNMKGLWVGKDFALGYKREGNVAFLTSLGEEHGYSVRPIEFVTLDDNDTRISSTTIRDLLAEGNVEAAADLLGRYYTVEGIVVEGDKRGRLIGFPTANTAVWAQQMLPANGVYAGWATVAGDRFMAVANVGVRPTFEGTTITIEPHLLDFDHDIYGKTLELSFVKRLRGEQRFNGIDALKAQLEQDVSAGRRILEGLA